MGSNPLGPTTQDDRDTVAVTGGSGFVGGHLVAALTDLGKNVVIVDLAKPPKALADLPGVQHRRADLRDYGETLLALRGVDTVYHLAGNASGTLSVEYPRFDFQINGLGTCNVGNACVELGVRRLVHMSSAIVYGTPRHFPMNEKHPTAPFLPYGASKRSGELTLLSLHEAFDLPVMIGRSFVVWGPGEDPRTAGGEVSQFLRWQLNELPIPVVGDVDRKTRDFVHVTDVCRALIALGDAGEPGEIYNIGSGTEVSMRGLADAVADATGRPARLQADTSVLDDSFRLVADIAKLRGIGYQPSVPLEKGLKDLADLLGPFPELPTVTVAFRREHAERA
ncbi:NAD-dependent epimerase/dehydratase family protein [Actinomadura yumaensis]|uniref:NAD-dependent epimerase/dehydratase family protein n=1 Tax=Actinomadura TaxID=1988 RepID=UPI00132A34F8|nr:NAD-dependent epimerase/dehydratase family protein [Actinomadura sp. J1-007]MWK38881.1 NAD-dependent epimerase/dehydratase family protein [Actinomadura sp. J1-007]